MSSAARRTLLFSGRFVRHEAMWYTNHTCVACPSQLGRYAAPLAACGHQKLASGPETPSDYRVPTGKTGKMAKIIPCQGKHREFGNFAKTQEILFAQVVNSLVLKVKGIVIIALKSPISFRGWICLPSQFCVCNSHKSHTLAQGRFAVGQGKHREYENAL